MLPRLALLGAPLAHGAAAGLAPPAFPVPEDVDIWSVVVDEIGRAELVPGIAGRRAIAWGSFSDKINETGWAVLDMHTSEEADGQKQGYAAGFLEGALTSRRMRQQLHNTWTTDFHGQQVGSMPDSVRVFVADNIEWMWQQTELHEVEPYWRTVASLLAQLRGLTDGYNHAAAHSEGELEPLMETEVFMLSLLDADMDDLMTAIALNGSFANLHGSRFHGHRHGYPRPALMSDYHRGKIPDNVPGLRGHCSALVQAAPGWSDLWVSHATFDEYRAMMKVVKYLDMPIPAAAVRRMVFTSLPGTLYSADDFYNTDAGLTIIETSITNYNQSAWGTVAPKSIMTWARAMVANRLATSGEEWTELFQRHMSGTLNNQWMVVDFKRFRPGEIPRDGDGLLWVSETMPGYGRRADMTGVLSGQGSWPSYNIPYFEDVRAVGGYFEMQRRYSHHADDYSFERSPRALMFARAREQGAVDSLDAFMHFMRDTGAHDPLGKGNRCNAISGRCDLNPVDDGYDCFGAVDAKVSRWRPDLLDLSFMGVLSPAHNGVGSDTPPFAWSAQNSSVDGCRPSQHVGHPDVFDFSWYSFPARLDGPRPHEGSMARDADRGRLASLVRAWSFASYGQGEEAARAQLAATTLALTATISFSAATTWRFWGCSRARRRGGGPDAGEQVYLRLAA